MILMGMMADATEECLALTRFMDTAVLRVEGLSKQVTDFTARVDLLFKKNVCLETGFTKVALEHLAQQKMIKLAENKYMMLGGPQAQREIANATTKALRKFRAWADLVHEVVQTEFPDFELLAAFSVFWLDESMEGTANRAPHSVGPSNWSLNCLRRLADVFGVPEDRLKEEFQDHQRIAQTVRNQNAHMTSASAWAGALRATQSKATKNGRTSRSNIWQQSALRPVVQRLLVAPGSTTSLEQTFSRKKWLLGEQWNGSPEADQRQLILQEEVRMKETPDASLIADARRIWVNHLGASRKAGDSRPLALGMRSSLYRAAQKRKAAAVDSLAKATTSSSWLAHRRKTVDDVLMKSKQMGPTSKRPCHGPGEEWTAAHEEEKELQLDRRHERLCRAVEQGTASHASLGPGAQAKLAEFQEKEQKRQKDLNADYRKSARIHARHTFKFNWHDQPVYFHPDIATPANMAHAHRALRALGARQVDKVAAGQVFVVLNPTDPPEQAMAVATLVGGLMCTFEHLLSAANGTRRGVALKLRRGLATPRSIFVSRSFQTKLAATLNILREVATNNKQGPRNWRWFDDDDDSLTRFRAKARKLGKIHQSQVASLVTRADRLSLRYRNLPRTMRLRELLSGSYRVDPMFSRQGICKR